MSDRTGRFLRATPRSRREELVLALRLPSVEGGAFRRMLAGMASSISASSDGAPMTFSICVALVRTRADVPGLERTGGVRTHG